MRIAAPAATVDGMTTTTPRPTRVAIRAARLFDGSAVSESRGNVHDLH
jgi:hypothetical protein